MEIVSEFYSDDGKIEAHIRKAEQGHSIFFYEGGEMVAVRNFPDSSMPYLETVAENHVLGLKQY